MLLRFIKIVLEGPATSLEPEWVADWSERKDDKVDDKESVEFVDDNAEAVTE